MEQSLNILIVDDSQAVRQDLRSKFESLGHQIVGEAANGIEALDEIKKLQPDLVSLDIIMPEMDGIECYSNMRKSFDKPPRCILISALSEEPRVIENYAEEINPDHYLSKGCTSESLAEKIAVVFSVEPLASPVVNQA